MNVTSSIEIIGRLPEGDQVVKLETSGDYISKIETVEESSFTVDLPYVAPGFIDNQVNGFMGVDFTEPNLTVNKVKKATKALWKIGVTTYLPTLITCDPAILKANLSVLSEAMQDPEIGDSLTGLHLEGPYISAEDGYRGAHNRNWVRLPDWEEFQDFQRAAQNGISQVTLAPEVEGGLEFIRRAKELGLIIALGHHNASSEIINKAVDAGATIATHLGNACANMIHRHENPIWPQLASDQLMVSLIADGRHLTADEVKTFYKAKGREHLILISDMTKLAGMPAGEYTWNGKKVVLTGEGYIKYPEQDVLAGSSMSLETGIGNVTRLTGCSLSEALQLVTANPAHLNRLDDRGTLKKRKRADLVLFTFHEGRIQINKTIIGGKVVHKNEEC